MIYEILPKKIYKAKVKNFDAVQSEIANVIKDYDWGYKHPKEWGKLAKYAKFESMAEDVISEKGMQNMMNEIMDAVSVFDPNYEFNEHTRAESWILKYDTGDYGHIHGHDSKGHHISGAYFHKLGEEGHFFFVDRENGESLHIHGEEGDLLLFPSYLWHGVTRVKGEKITLSFDLNW